MEGLWKTLQENFLFVIVCVVIIAALSLLAHLAERFLPAKRKVTVAKRVSIIGICGAIASVLHILDFPLLFMAGLSSAFEYRIINGIRLPRLLRPALLILALFLGTGLFIGACLMFGVYDSIKSALPKRKINNDQG